MTPAETARHDRFLRQFTTAESAIRAYVRRLVPTRTDADDVMQDVSVVLWKKFEKFNEEGDFRGWAFGVARYQVMAWRRDKARDRLVLDENLVARLADESAAAEPVLQRQREALEDCMKKVEPGQRTLLLQAYQPRLRIQDLAAHSGRSAPGFYQWLHRVRRMLLDCIRRSLSQRAAS